MNINTVLVLAVAIGIIGLLAAYGDNMLTFFRGEADQAGTRAGTVSTNIGQDAPAVGN